MNSETLMAQPGFRPAVARYCDALAEPAPPGWPARKLLNQLGRYYAAYMLIRQYYAWRQGDPAVPTLTQLQTVSGLSPRQTASFVGILASGKLLTTEPLEGDRRQKLLVPMPALTLEIGRSVIAFLRAYGQLSHAPRLVDLASPDVIGGIIHRSADRVLGSGTVLDGFPVVRDMTGFDCGYQLLVALMAAHYRREAGHTTFSTAYSALAERFQVSQSHVGNVVLHLRKVGAIETGDKISRAMVREFEHWCAAEMLHYGPLAL